RLPFAVAATVGDRRSAVIGRCNLSAALDGRCAVPTWRRATVEFWRSAADESSAAATVDLRRLLLGGERRLQRPRLELHPQSARPVASPRARKSGADAFGATAASAL